MFGLLKRRHFLTGLAAAMLSWGSAFTMFTYLRPFLERVTGADVQLLSILLLVLGCVIDQVSMMMITLPFFMPLANAAGIDPVWLGVMLLVAMERHGIAAPSHCRSGVCGWCHSRLVSGDVYVPSTIDGRRMADVDYGYIHPCGTFPLGDVVLEVPPFRA